MVGARAQQHEMIGAEPFEESDLFRAPVVVVGFSGLEPGVRVGEHGLHGREVVHGGTHVGQRICYPIDQARTSRLGHDGQQDLDEAELSAGVGGFALGRVQPSGTTAGKIATATWPCSDSSATMLSIWNGRSISMISSTLPVRPAAGSCRIRTRGNRAAFSVAQIGRASWRERVSKHV